jgi:peptidoglycan hydrolase CwlO-like protein
VADVYPDMVARNKDGEVEGVNYQFLAPMLLNDLQKQHQHIDRLESENANLRGQLESLIRRVEQVEGKITER